MGGLLERNEEPSSEEENFSSIRQFEDNLEQAERTPYRQMMSETVTLSHEEAEQEQYMQFVEDMKRAQQYSATKDLAIRSVRRERERRAEKERREKREERREKREERREMRDERREKRDERRKKREKREERREKRDERGEKREERREKREEREERREKERERERERERGHS